MQVKSDFWKLVDSSPGHGPNGDCWIWQGTRIKNGYGRVSLKVYSEIERFAHRIAWELTHGPIPKGTGYHGTCVLHSCHNGAGGCVNPDHLHLGTAKTNHDEMKLAGRGRDGTKNGRSILSEDDVRTILATPQYFGVCADLSRRFKVSIASISQIRLGKKWAKISRSTNGQA